MATKTAKTTKTTEEAPKVTGATEKAPEGTKKATPAADRHMAEVPAAERRENLVKALRRAKATSETKALALEDLVERLGYTRFDVYGLVNGTSGKAGSSPNCLVATGHVATTVREGAKGLHVYLTRKGASGEVKTPAKAAKE